MMNHRQRVVVVAALGLAAVMALFPPWYMGSSHPVEWMFIGQSSYVWPVRIDFGRLLTQWMVLGAAAGAIVVYCGRKQ